MNDDSNSHDAETLSTSLGAFARFSWARRSLIGSLALAGAAVAAVVSLLSVRQFLATTTFVPEDGSGNAQSLVRAAQQFGLAVPADRTAWPPALYLAVLKSGSMLHPLAADSFALPERGGKREALVDLLDAPGDTPDRRVERAVRILRQRIIHVTESRATGTVSIEVLTPWPSLSYTLARALLDGANTFNVSVRQTQAAAELEYAEARTTEAQTALREAEDELLGFLNRNRVTNSAPTLVFQRERLESEVEQRRSLYYALVSRRDEARLRKVRDTPVISVIDEPRMPVIGQSRGTVFRTVMGALAGALAGIGLALLLGNRTRILDRTAA